MAARKNNASPQTPAKTAVVTARFSQINDEAFTKWQGRAEEFLLFYNQLDAARVFLQLFQVGGYTLAVNKDALKKALAQMGGPNPITKGALLAHASEILKPVKVDKKDETEEGILYADSVERARTLYAGFAVSLSHPSPDTPVKGIMPGVFAVMGETRSGKTTYIRDIAKPDLIIRAAEPFEPVDCDSNVVTVRTYPQAFGLVLLGALTRTRVAIDSLRGLVFNMRGNAGEGGVSTALYELLTTLNNFSAEFGAVTFLAVNPMVGDNEKVMRLLSRFEASVAAIVFLDSGKVKYGSIRTLSGRQVTTEGSTAGAIKTDLPIFSTTLPQNGTDLMVNVDALGGDAPRVLSSRLIGADATADNPSATRVFPTLPFDNL